MVIIQMVFLKMLIGVGGQVEQEHRRCMSRVAREMAVQARYRAETRVICIIIPGTTIATAVPSNTIPAGVGRFVSPTENARICSRQCLAWP